MTRMKLDSMGVRYTEHDVDTDDVALEYIKSMGYQQVPVVFFGGEHWSGFRPDKLAEVQAYFEPTH